MHIAITNHTGARNRGCEALVEGILAGISNQSILASAHLTLHTGDYDFDCWRFQHHTAARLELRRSYLRYLGNHLPFPLANKALYHGMKLAEKCLPARFVALRDFSSAAAADLIITAGGDVFSSDYGNFRRHASYLHLGTPVFLCAQSMGPMTRADETYLKQSIRNIVLLTARESHTYSWLKSLNLSCRIEQTADVAFNLPVMSKADTLRYAHDFMHIDLSSDSFIALSLSELITKYSPNSRADDTATFARVVDALNKKGHRVILIPHVAERNFKNDDTRTCHDVLRHAKNPAANIMMPGWFSSIEAKSVIGLCAALLGARTHATIAALSQGIPTVSIAYSRKAHGIMDDFYGPTRGKELTLTANTLEEGALLDALEKAMTYGPQPAAATLMKARAAENFVLIATIMEKRGWT